VALGADRDGRDRHAELRGRDDPEARLLLGEPHSGVSQHRSGTESNSEQDELWFAAERAEVEGRADPDEEQRSEEPFGQREQLMRETPRLSDRRYRQSQREPAQHDRHLGGLCQRGEREQHEQAHAQLQGELPLLTEVV
jgi:hypothetical protein